MAIFQRKTRILPLLIPLLLILIFISLTTRTARRAPWYEELFWNLIYRPQRIANSVSDNMSDLWHHYVALIGAQKKNDVLTKRVAKLEGELIYSVELEEENKRLRDLLAYHDSFPYTTIVARVIANDPKAEFKSITINRGNKDGVKPLMSVVGPKGLVGRVGKVGSRFSQVLLIIDPNSTVDVLVQRSRARGLVIGTARRTELRPGYYLSRLEYLRRVSDVSDGDVVVTSGFDQVFPPGIPVGTISGLTKSRYGVFREATVVPFENMAELQEVLVLLRRMKPVSIESLEE